MSPVSNANLLDGVNGFSNGVSPVGLQPKTHKQDLAENPLDRVWRGNKEGTVSMAGVPKFTNKYDEREWIKVNASRIPYVEPLTQCDCIGAYGGSLSLLGQAWFW
jgi:hypothetical protein